ncbi:MAG: T9SS type A sorting domain-containing protein [Ignavibacteria bacterium]
MKNKINYLFIILTVSLTAAFLIQFYYKNAELNDIKKANRIKTTSGALESMQFLSEMRAFPDKDIPPDKYFKAFEHTKNNMQELDEGDSPTEWTSIGPNNIGGRSLCLAFSPLDTGTIYIGAASGGLWKSNTGGLGASAWTLINTGYPSLAVSSIAIDSANPNIMYIGTGENYGYQYSLNGLDVRVTRGMYGIGVLKTTNGGSTWFKSLDWSYNNQRGVWRVIFNPRNRNVLYAATSEGVWKTNNAGANWFQVLNYLMAMDLEINPIDTSVLYVSIGNLTNNVPLANVGVYKTTNSGATWTELAGGLPQNWTGKTTIELYKGNPNFVYANVSNDFSYVGYYTSTDAGNSWSLRNSSIPVGVQGWYNQAHLVKPDDPNTIVAGTIDVVKSTNGGLSFVTKSNWSLWVTGPTPPGDPESPSPQFAHADHHEFYSNPRDPNKLYCITDGGLYRSNNFGETYYSCNGGYVTSQFYAGFANSRQDSIFCIGGMQDNRSAFYQGTVAWYKTFVGDGFWCAVNSQNHNICYTEYTYGSISKSFNGGVSWSGISPPGGGSSSQYCFAAPYIACRSNPNIMYVGGISIYKSVVGGGSWQGPYGSFGGAKVLSMDASATSTDTLYCGTIPTGSVQAAIHRSVDGGLTWTNISGGLIPNRYPIDIHVDPNNSRIVYVTFGGFGSGHVFKTPNSGVNWVNISDNLPDLPHQCVVVDPLYPQNVYVGNDLGVYVSTTGGLAWYEYRNGMPYALVFDLTVVYPNRHIRATTHGSGIYERSLVQNPLTGIISNNQIPKEFKLYQNYPNPFNPVTKIKFDVPKSAILSGAKNLILLKIYDILGREAATLVNEQLKPGTYEVDFNGTGYSSGIYFYNLVTNDFAETKKMILVK